MVIDEDRRPDHASWSGDAGMRLHLLGELASRSAAIEKAWLEGKTAFRKPISCHLYPIRVVRFSNGTAGLNYHRWSVCAPARECGRRLGIPVYKALREPIVRRFGEEFYKALEAAEEFIRQQ